MPKQLQSFFSHSTSLQGSNPSLTKDLVVLEMTF